MSRDRFRERAAVLSVLCAMALVVMDAGVVAIALPTIGHALGEAPERSLLIVSAYQLALLAGLLPCAHLADRFGYRRLFLIGVVLFSGSAVLSALAPSLPLLIAARGLQGLGSAAIMSLGMALLRFALGSSRLGAAIGWNALVVAACSGLAPMAGGAMLSFAGWRWLFLIALPLAGVALISAFALPPVKPTRRSVDLLGVSLFAAAPACLAAAAHWAGSDPLPALAAVVGALSCAFWLFARERGRKTPLVPLDLLALRPFRTSVTASVLLFTGQSAGLLALPFYLQLTLGRSAVAAGLLLALWPLAVAATSPAANRLADRFEPGPLCAAGGLLLAMGLAAAALWPVERTIAPLLACAMICGTGFGLFQVPNNRSLFLAAPADRGAAAGGLQGTARLAGQTAGALLVAFVLSAAPLEIAPRLAIGLAGVAALMASFISLGGAAAIGPGRRDRTLPLRRLSAPRGRPLFRDRR
jgi:DHA2 family multidrug resistance protein-like MFS transporter